MVMTVTEAVIAAETVGTGVFQRPAITLNCRWNQCSWPRKQHEERMWAQVRDLHTGDDLEGL